MFSKLVSKWVSKTLAVVFIAAILVAPGATHAFAAETPVLEDTQIARANITSITNNGGQYEDSALTKAIDGTTDHWETGKPNSANFKNAVTVTFDQLYTINKIQYQVRQDEDLKGFPLEYNIYYSTTASGEDFSLLSTGSFANPDGSVISFHFDATKLRRVRFEFVKAYQNWASIAEISFFKPDFYFDNLTQTLNAEMGALDADSLNAKLADPQFKNTLLQWQFLNHVGSATATKISAADADHKAFMDWLLNDTDALETYLLAGEETDGNSAAALEIFYKIWKSDPDSHCGFYLKLAVATATELAEPISFWLDESQQVDPVNRYDIYKQADQNNELLPAFRTYDVAHLRLVINAKITDNDLTWVRNYVKTNYPDLAEQDNLAGACWILEYNEENPYGVSIFDDGFYGEHPTLQTVVDYGGVCGTLSTFSSMVAKSFGVASFAVGQPGHCAFVIMNGPHEWSLEYDISGWAETEGGALPQVWYGDDYNSVSVLLFEEATADPEKMSKSQELEWLAGAANSGTSAAAIREAAIQAQPLNIMVWKDKINAMLADPTVTSSQWLALSSEVMGAFANHPKPMSDLLDLFEDKLVNGDKAVKQQYIISYTNTLNAVTDDTQRSVADSILSSLENKNLVLGKFSFDGDNAGKLMGTDTDMEYSLDGGKTFLAVTSADMALSGQEIGSITAENGIRLRLKGSAESLLIEISAGASVGNVSANDETNQIFNLTNKMEFSTDNGATWTKYTTAANLPDLKGDLVMLVRHYASGTNLAGAAKKLTFANNTDPELLLPSQMTASATSFESEEEAAASAIDGNKATIWHTKWDGSDKLPQSITITLDDTYPLYKLAYLPRQDDDSANGNIKAYNLYTSTDGTNFVKVTSGTWANNSSKKTIEFTPVAAKYVKLEVTSGVGGFASAAELSLFKKDTVAPTPEPTVTPVPTDPGAAVTDTYKLVNVNSGKCLAVSGDASVVQMAAGADNSQQWVVADAGNGYSYITVASSGLALTVPEPSTKKGTKLQTAAYTGAATQLWAITDAGNGNSKIINKNSGFAIDISDESKADGAAAIQWKYAGDKNQLWVLTKVATDTPTVTPTPEPTVTPEPTNPPEPTVTPEPTDPGAAVTETYKLVNVNSSKCLAVSGDASVVQMAAGADNSQQWVVTDAGDGYCYITVASSGLALTVPDSATKKGTKLQTAAYTGGANQLWTIADAGNGNSKIINKNSGLAVDVSDESKEDGAAAIQWKYAGDNNQLWVLTKVQ